MTLLRMLGRRTYAVQAGAGTDMVLWGITLPSGTIVHDIMVDLSFIGTVEAVSFAAAFMVGFEAWVLPMLDPEGNVSYDTMWDALVPKDSDVEQLDMDTGAADTTPFFEPGEIDLSAIFDVGLRPHRLFHHHRLITIANGAVSSWQDNQSVFLPKYWPGGTMRWRRRKPIRVNQPSVLVMAVAAPNLDDTVTTNFRLKEGQIVRLKYMKYELERAFMHVLQLTEAGAETPWEEATALLMEHLDPDIYEQLADSMIAASWNVWGEAHIDHSVVGEIGITRVDSGR